MHAAFQSLQRHHLNPETADRARKKSSNIEENNEWEAADPVTQSGCFGLPRIETAFVTARWLQARKTQGHSP